MLIAAGYVAWSGTYTPATGIGYLLGVIGGVMMLLLFLYPLRKHLRLLHGLGATKHWFALHMLFGVLGPVFILMHSTLRVGSLNAAVALICMLLVAGSGVAGRFIYTRIHHGLYGERARLRDLQGELATQLQALQGALRAAPSVHPLLKAFEADALRKDAGAWFRAWRFLTLGQRARRALRQCTRALRHAHAAEAQRLGWSDETRTQRSAQARALVAAYLASVQRIAQFSTWERLFSWWHVLHVPLVYMLVLSAVAHVVAVHIY